jgi:hypothetical protein
VSSTRQYASALCIYVGVCGESGKATQSTHSVMTKSSVIYIVACLALCSDALLPRKARNVAYVRLRKQKNFGLPAADSESNKMN